jgi:hypothetical protein
MVLLFSALYRDTGISGYGGYGGYNPQKPSLFRLGSCESCQREFTSSARSCELDLARPHSRWHLDIKVLSQKVPKIFHSKRSKRLIWRAYP